MLVKKEKEEKTEKKKTEKKEEKVDSEAAPTADAWIKTAGFGHGEEKRGALPHQERRLQTMFAKPGQGTLSCFNLTQIKEKQGTLSTWTWDWASRRWRTNGCYVPWTRIPSLSIPS